KGDRFKKPKTVTTASAFNPHITIDDSDNIYVALSSQFIMLVTRSTDRGKTFSSPMIISEPTKERQFLDSPFVIASAPNVINVVWEKQTENNSEIILVGSTDGGKSFSKELNLSNNYGQSTKPLAATDKAGNIIISWDDDSPANPDVFLNIVPAK